MFRRGDMRETVRVRRAVSRYLAVDYARDLMIDCPVPSVKEIGPENF